MLSTKVKNFMNAEGVVNFGCRFDVGTRKPAMMDLRQWHGVNIGVLADKGDVEPSKIYSMLLGRPVQRSEAALVLSGLSRLVGVEYVLDDIDVVLFDE
jgi:hypothetical protein